MDDQPAIGLRDDRINSDGAAFEKLVADRDQVYVKAGGDDGIGRIAHRAVRPFNGAKLIDPDLASVGVQHGEQLWRCHCGINRHRNVEVPAGVERGVADHRAGAAFAVINVDDDEAGAAAVSAGDGHGAIKRDLIGHFYRRRVHRILCA